MPAVVEKSTQPKPRKEEIIAAMAIVKRQQQVEEAERAKAEADALDEKATSELLRHFTDNQKAYKPEVSKGYRSQSGFNNIEISYDLTRDLPKALKDLMIKVYDARQKSVRVQDLISIRKEIRDKMANRLTETDRIKALTETPTVRKALTKMIEELESPSIKV